MSPLDRELMATLGELVLIKQASDKTAGPFSTIGRGADWLGIGS